MRRRFDDDGRMGGDLNFPTYLKIPLTYQKALGTLLDYMKAHPYSAEKQKQVDEVARLRARVTKDIESLRRCQ